MPAESDKVKADITLEINESHPISNKLKELYENKDNESLAKYTKVLYNQARLLSGLNVDNAAELTDIICNLMSK